jgi:hypothetical protein
LAPDAPATGSTEVVTAGPICGGAGLLSNG